MRGTPAPLLQHWIRYEHVNGCHISVLSLWSYVTQLACLLFSKVSGCGHAIHSGHEKFLSVKNIFSTMEKNCSLKVPSYGLVWMHYCGEQNLRVDLHNGKYHFREEIDENCNCGKFVCGQDFIGSTVYSLTRLLQCPHDVPQRLMFLTIIYNRLHAWDGHHTRRRRVRWCPSHACDLS